MKLGKILLGFEIGTATPIYISPGHLIVTGLTQRSGKTTTLEALVYRSKTKAIVFITKPGETGISTGQAIPPYFIEHSDWQYVEALLEATMEEKMKWERSWIIILSKGTHSLKEVNENVMNELEKMEKRGKTENIKYDILTRLHAYFEIVLPQIEKTNFSKSLKLKNGINIMDLQSLTDEVQALVIRSVLEHILKEEKEVISIIPECWKFIPEKTNAPAKDAVIQLIRQGATRDNYVWFDSQDLAGTDKKPIKQVFNWILGLQTEKNEVMHTLDQMPISKSKRPKPEEVMTLEIGHFFYCSPDKNAKVYVMPSWLDEDVAKKISLGEIKVEQVMDRKITKIEEIITDYTGMDAMKIEQDRLAHMINTKEEALVKLNEENKHLKITNDNMKIQLESMHNRIEELLGDNEVLKKKAQALDEIEYVFKQVAMGKFPDVPKFKEARPTTAMPIPQIEFPPEIKAEFDLPNALKIPLEDNLLYQRLPKAPKIIFDALYAQAHKWKENRNQPIGLTRIGIATVTGYAPKSGSFRNSISYLNSRKLIKKDGEIYSVA